MAGAHGAEVSIVERDDSVDIETLRQGNDGRIGAAQRKVAVLRHQVSDPGPVVRRRALHVHTGQTSEELCLDVGTETRPDEVSGFGDDERGDDQAMLGLFEDSATSCMIAVVLIHDRIEWSCVNDDEHAPIPR